MVTRLYSCKQEYLPYIITQLYSEGTLQDTFYNTDVKPESCETILKFLTSIIDNVFVVYHKNRFAGLVWFDNVSGRASARIHMVGCKWTWGRTSLTMGKNILAQALNIFNVVIGNTPTHLRSMVAYLKRCGMKEVAIIPNALYVASLNKNVDMLVSTISRKDIK